MAETGLAPGAIRKYYEHRRTPILSSSRARQDILALLEDRKRVARAAEVLMNSALPYSGDANVKSAIENFRAVLEGRTNS